MKKFLAYAVAAVVLIGMLLLATGSASVFSSFLSSSEAPQKVNTAVFTCDGGKTIRAAFYRGAQKTEAQGPGMPPVPNGSVELVLSDGRFMTLPQTISASGIRYANAGEAIIFWSKGNTAFIQEEVNLEQQTTYAGCIATQTLPDEENWGTFASSTLGVSVRYPRGYALQSPYQYTGIGPGKEISGIKFIIPASVAEGTNLSDFDTGVSVEELSSAGGCTGKKFLGEGAVSTSTAVENGTTYSVAQGMGAGAGNLYEEIVYAIPGTSPCIAVRYLIHSMQIANYPPGIVRVFDRDALLKDFDGVRRSLILGK